MTSPPRVAVARDTNVANNHRFIILSSMLLNALDAFHCRCTNGSVSTLLSAEEFLENRRNAW
jgi:hypothetical protein